jgi:hypothetical protein
LARTAVWNVTGNDAPLLSELANQVAKQVIFFFGPFLSAFHRWGDSKGYSKIEKIPVLIMCQILQSYMDAAR